MGTKYTNKLKYKNIKIQYGSIKNKDTFSKIIFF